MLLKKTSYNLGAIAMLALLLAVFSILTSCGQQPKQPKITRITPEGGHAGTAVTIEGENFNPNPEKNKVFFADNKEAEVKSSSSSRIETEVPLNAISGVIIITTDKGTAVSKESFNAQKSPCENMVIEIKNAGFPPTKCTPPPVVPTPPVPSDPICLAPFTGYQNISFVPTPQGYVRYNDFTGDGFKEIEIFGSQLPSTVPSKLDMFFGALSCEVHEVIVEIHDGLGDAKLEGTDYPNGTLQSNTSSGQGNMTLTIIADPDCYFNGVTLSGQEVLFFKMTLK